MASQIGQSGLQLPKLSGGNGKRKIMLTSLQSWRSKLPLSDVAATAKSLYVTLQDSNQSNLTHQERFAILNFVRPTLNFVTQGLQKFYRDRETLTEKQIQIADLINNLNLEMLNGYKLVVDKAYSDFFWKKKLLIAGIQSAMQSCTKILLDAYEQHRSPPAGVWHDLHTLFHIADKKNVLHRSLRHNVDWYSQFKTLADTYKHILLFSIANPYRFRREETTHLLYALETWAPLMIIKNVRSGTQSLYYVDLKSDQAPKCSVFQSGVQIGTALILDKINEHLIKLLEAKKNHEEAALVKQYSSAELMLPPMFVESLVSIWNSLNVMQRTRKKKQGYITVSLGIPATHWFISNETTLYTSAPAIGSQNNHAAPSIAEDPDTDIMIDIDLLPNPSILQESQTLGFPNYQCELIDQSEGGYCLKWLEEAPAQLHCGEIISLEKEIILENETTEKIWEIGTIRWLKNEEDLSVLFGVQILSTIAFPCKARISETANAQSITTLMIPEQPETNTPMMLITPPLLFKSEMEVEVEYGQQKLRATLQKNMSLSTSYQAFTLEFPEGKFTFPQITFAAIQPTQAANQN